MSLLRTCLSAQSDGTVSPHCSTSCSFPPPLVPRHPPCRQTDPLSPELTKLAALLGVPAPAVARELAALPADVPADVYYSRMVLSLQQQRNLFGSAAGADATASLVERYRPIFAHYDKAGRGFLEAAELRSVLGDLSEAGAAGAGPTGPELERAFALADQDGDGRVSPEEFAR